MERKVHLTPDADLPALYQWIAMERPKVVFWGLVGAFPLYMLANKLPIDLIIDGNETWHGRQIYGAVVTSPDSLVEMDVKNTVIVLMPFTENFRDEILARIESIGLFKVIPPFRPEVEGVILAAMGGASLHHAAPGAVLATAQMLDIARSNARASRAACLAALCPVKPPKLSVSRRVVLTYGQFFVGGAERQLCQLAAGLAERGWDVELLILSAPGTGSEHYQQFLASHGVRLKTLEAARKLWALGETLPSSVDEFRAIFPILEFLNGVTAYQTLVFYREIVCLKPDLLISFTDGPNVAAGYAALCAGVPSIQLSCRITDLAQQVHHFGFSIEYLREHYLTFLGCSSIKLTHNSAVGARLYAEWLDVDQEKFGIVRNGVDAESIEKSATTPSELRSAFGISKDALLILGIFRLSYEKNPVLFVEVIRFISEKIPSVRALIIGEGAMRQATLSAIEAAGLEEVIMLTGPRAEPWSDMAAADLLLHTARGEGTPNVLLEAQIVGLPIVCTSAGGTRECLAPQLQAYCHDETDAATLARSCLDLLENGNKRTALKGHASEFVKRQFPLAAATEATLALALHPR